MRVGVGAAGVGRGAHLARGAKAGVGVGGVGAPVGQGAEIDSKVGGGARPDLRAEIAAGVGAGGAGARVDPGAGVETGAGRGTRAEIAGAEVGARAVAGADGIGQSRQALNTHMDGTKAIKAISRAYQKSQKKKNLSYDMLRPARPCRKCRTPPSACPRLCGPRTRRPCLRSGTGSRACFYAP